MISVVIPTYNRKDTIKRAIDSVFNQSLKPSEVIIVDDGSTDNTIDYLHDVYGNNIRVISTEGRVGACVARNLGIENAKFRYIAFQDSDDIWIFDKLETQINAMKSSGASICFSSFVKISDSKVVLYPSKGAVSNSDGIVRESALTDALLVNHMSTQTLIVDTDRVNPCFDPSLSRFQDWDLYLSFFQSGERMVYVDNPLAVVEVGEDSITRNYKAGISSRKELIRKYSAKSPFGLKVRLYINLYFRILAGWILCK